MDGIRMQEGGFHVGAKKFSNALHVHIWALLAVYNGTLCDAPPCGSSQECRARALLICVASDRLELNIKAPSVRMPGAQHINVSWAAQEFMESHGTHTF